MLQFLVTRGVRPSAGARYVWEDPEANAAEGPAREVLDEARRFAVAIHGAALLYNLLLAERAEALELPANEGRRDRFATRLDDWSQKIEGSDIMSWDLDGLWTLVARQGRPVTAPTRHFVTSWVDLIRSGIGEGLADDREARTLITEREVFQKKNQSRLRNDRLMQQWGGASGAGRLDFRWPNIKTLLNDIADGRENGLARP